MKTQECKKEISKMSCIDCWVTACNKKPGMVDKTYPDFCPTPLLHPEEGNVDHKSQTSAEEALMQEVMAVYEEPQVKEIMIAAAAVEYEHYCSYTRVQEVMDFARRIGAKRLGIATCAGLIRESRTLAQIMRANGFEVIGLCCKTGAIPKHEVGIPQCCEAIGQNMCNPILQAKMLNKEKTDLNLVVGLCVGHDSLFYRYSEAPVTTVVTKDRVLGHNPAAALYTAESYYKKLYQ